MARWFGIKGGPGGGVDYAQLIKNFSGKRRGKDYDRYAPAKSGQPLTTKRAVYGDPDLETCSTSFVERSNLQVRNFLKRFARRGTGFSKSLRAIDGGKAPSRQATIWTVLKEALQHPKEKDPPDRTDG